jgi:glycosyltransferase involved in cell wall biosynthesis
VNSYYPPWIGGAETYVSSLARSLDARGHDITVYCSDRPLHAGESKEKGIRLVRMHTPAAFYGTPLVFFPPKFLAEKYDIIHANFPSPYLAAISAWIAKAHNSPAVLTWHNDLPPVTRMAGVLVKIHESLVAPTYLDFYKRIIATTSAYGKKSRILGRYSGKIAVINNGVDTSVFNPRNNGDLVRRQFSIAQSDKVVLFVGALTKWHAYKGVDVLIKAFKATFESCRDAKLLIVGEGNLTNYYKSLVEELGLSKNVIFAGKVTDADLPSYYAACDFTVLPSRDASEGFGLVLLEAMATGKPVIGSRVGGIVDVITEKETGLFVEPGREDQLASAMEYLIKDDSRRLAMGDAARRFAEMHDWSSVAQRVEALYSEIR